MDGIRKILVVLALAAILAAFTAPAVAQRAGMPMATATMMPTRAPGMAGGMQGMQTTQSMMPTETSSKDMMATMSGMSDASMATSMMKAAGVDTMMKTGSHTLFVPSDSAVKSLGMDAASINKMMADKSMATKTMQGFMMNSMVKPSDMTDGKTLTMMNGKTMTVKNMNGQMTLDGAKITKAVQTSNGMIYMIDSMPSSMMSMAMMSK